MKQFHIKITNDSWWSNLSATYVDRPNGHKKSSADDIKDMLRDIRGKSRSQSRSGHRRTAPS
jgi:hypothetical protein